MPEVSNLYVALRNERVQRFCSPAVAPTLCVVGFHFLNPAVVRQCEAPPPLKATRSVLSSRLA